MRPTWAEVNLNSLKSNYNLLKSIIGEDVRVLSVVKADAYGHGAPEIATVLSAMGSDLLGVASVTEAGELSDAGVTAPIALLGGIQPPEASQVLEHGYIPFIYTMDVARALDKAAKQLGTRGYYHLKIDTGMTRLGVKPEELSPFLSDLSGLENIEMEGVLTHLASAFLDDREYTDLQLGRFQQAVSVVMRAGFSPRYIHAANSASIQRYPESHLDMVRPGIMLYGSGTGRREELKPVMTLKTKIIQLKQVPKGTPVSYGGTHVTSRLSDVATLPIGYADGYTRRLGNRAFVMVNGERAPVVGDVCMDLTMVDVTGIPEVKNDTEVTLFGSGGLTVDEVAGWGDTISYELLSTVGKRVPRVYKSD